MLGANRQRRRTGKDSGTAMSTCWEAMSDLEQDSVKMLGTHVEMLEGNVRPWTGKDSGTAMSTCWKAMSVGGQAKIMGPRCQHAGRQCQTLDRQRQWDCNVVGPRWDRNVDMLGGNVGR